LTAPALKALATAQAAGVTVTLDGDGLILEADPEPSVAIVSLLKTVKPALLRIFAGRQAAYALLDASPPADCSETRWAAAQYGLQHFIGDGWCDQAALMGWTIEELYRAPPVWSRVDLTGAALLIGDRKVIAVTEASIAIETRSGSHLKFRRIGREHIA
jgi:hypothetical protein